MEIKSIMPPLVLHFKQLQMELILDVIIVVAMVLIITMVTWQTITLLTDWQKHQQILQQNIMVYGHLSHTTGTYPGSSVRLEFADASDLGNDTSGNNNDYALGGITSDHKKLDSPTINMCALLKIQWLLEEMFQLVISYYDGNTRLSHPNASGNQTFGIGTHEVSSGKWYFEVWINSENGNTNIGIGTQGDINSLNQHYHGYRNTGAISVKWN